LESSIIGTHSTILSKRPIILIGSIDEKTSRLLLCYKLWSTFFANEYNRGTILPPSAVDAIKPAYQHAKQQLFFPFRFAQWVRLAFVGLLAGELSSSGGCGGNNFQAPSTHRDPGTQQFLGMVLSPDISQHPAMLIAMILLVILAGAALLVLLMYVSSMMRFILLDSVLDKECHIRKGWIRRRSEGRRLLVWQIGLSLLTIGAFAVLLGIPAAGAWALGWFQQPKEHMAGLILGGLLLFLLFLALLLVTSVVYVMTKDFVVPQMALENISTGEGWRRLWIWVKGDKGSYLGYLGMKIVLAIGAGVALGIIAVVAVLLVLIPIGGAGAAAVFGGKAAGLTWDFFTIALAVVAGCIALTIILFVVSMISVPAIVFFPAYSIYFFATRYPALAARLWPPPAAPQREEPPPLPPELAPAG
jgi:hypothetical protein